MWSAEMCHRRPYHSPLTLQETMAVIELKNALFRPLADGFKKTVFKNPLSLVISENERWAVTGPRKSDLLQILASKHIPQDPLSRRYPFLGQSYWPTEVTQLVEFGQSTSIKASHLSARYESYRDEFDSSLNEYLQRADRNQENIDAVLEKFQLKHIKDRWIVGLSNGQNRRARLAYSILKHPQLLLVDEPMLGLDPPSRQKVASVLEQLPPKPHVVLGMRVQDELPSWITHVAITDSEGIAHQGTVVEMEPHLERLRQERLQRLQKSAADQNRVSNATDEVIIELDNVAVSYRGETIFDNLSFKAHRGEKWHLQGPNGSGKSTLLALLTADHPQSWNSKIKLFGEPRKTGHQSYFSINENIGHASPEIHALFPNQLTVENALSTGFVVGSFIPPRQLSDDQTARVNDALKQYDLDGSKKVSDLSLSDQKTVMFIRAIIKQPKILILDEAFSAMDETRIEQCKKAIDNYNGTVIVVGHIESEVPQCDKFIRFTHDRKVEQGNL